MLGNEYILNNPEIIVPFSAKQIQPASYDLRIDHVIKTIESPLINIGAGWCVHEYKNKPKVGEHLHLAPGEFAIGSTIEKICLPAGIAAKVDGRSSVGRLGLSVHITAGFIDPGFHGQITLELKNGTDKDMFIVPGCRICQIEFFRVEECSISYSGKYQEQEGPTGSRMYQDVVPYSQLRWEQKSRKELFK